MPTANLEAINGHSASALDGMSGAGRQASTLLYAPHPLGFGFAVGPCDFAPHVGIPRHAGVRVAGHGAGWADVVNYRQV